MARSLYWRSRQTASRRQQALGERPATLHTGPAFAPTNASSRSGRTACRSATSVRCKAHGNSGAVAARQARHPINPAVKRPRRKRRGKVGKRRPISTPDIDQRALFGMTRVRQHKIDQRPRTGRRAAGRVEYDLLDTAEKRVDLVLPIYLLDLIEPPVIRQLLRCAAMVADGDRSAGGPRLAIRCHARQRSKTCDNFQRAAGTDLAYRRHAKLAPVARARLRARPAGTITFARSSTLIVIVRHMTHSTCGFCAACHPRTRLEIASAHI